MPNTLGISDRAYKVLDAMKTNGLAVESKASDADHIAKLAKMPKGQVNEALQELVARKYAKHINHHKAARYALLPPPPAPKPAGAEETYNPYS